MADILLTTLNARYIHSSLGLRYLLVNLGELRHRAKLIEYTIEGQPLEIVESLLSHQPMIIGFGVYIWNVEQITKVIALLKQVAPEIIIVIGGPEVSHEWDEQHVVRLSDYLITGMADQRFAQLCQKLLNGERPSEKIMHADVVPLSEIALPYDFYTDEDIAHRILYVEASRGCPFKCEFCLSALDKTAWAFDLDAFLGEMDKLYQRGARHFKFVDRTFNLKIDHSAKILEFFLERLDEKLFLHFELIPDHLPDRLKTLIARFPNGSLQFEIGIQSFNPEVQKLISRKQDNAKSCDNLIWLRQQSHAHLHTDLIIGLPGETLESLAAGFNELIALDPHEIQVGILKRLRGMPLWRHENEFALRFNPAPPYNILSTRDIDFSTMLRLNRFARFWDLIVNSGHFSHTRSLILGDKPFEQFLTLSDWLYARLQQTHKIALKRLFDLLYLALTDIFGHDAERAREVLLQDYAQSGQKGRPEFGVETSTKEINHSTGANRRQRRHQ
ncbi:MAG: DUF4080 domain-containing protein [Gammaproteobacteria bacterium]|nr:DUF4080 domain-containing protein [Gammaproteobacteria bacterium]